MTPLMVRAGATREEVHTAVMAIYAAAKAMLDAGQIPRITLTEWEDDITVKQRGFLHAAVLPQIAEQVRVNGERFVPEIWKEYFRKLFLGSSWKMQKLPGQKRAVPVKVRISTEDLGIRAYSDYIDKVIAHAVTEWGVEFVFRTEDREAVRYVAPRRRPKVLAEQQEAVAA